MMKIDVAICSYEDICLIYEASIIQWNGEISQFLLVYTTKL